MFEARRSALTDHIATDVFARRRSARLLAVCALTLGLLGGATGCSLLNQLVPGSAPVRDAETGQITEGNTNAEVFSIRVGDCLNTDDTMSGEISSVPVVPCDQPHADEVFLAYDLEDAEFPGTDEVANAAYERCAMEFEAFVGIPYAESVLDVWPMYPTLNSWNDGDREVLCVVYDPAARTIGSLAGAAR